MTFFDADLDPQDMHGAILSFPKQLEEAWELGAAISGDAVDMESIRFVVVCGMGGSAIGGDLLRTYAEPTAPLPIAVVRDYDLPSWVDDETLVISSSYSGNTEETLSTFEQAIDRGATVIGVTSGGRLAARCSEEGCPLITIPGGLQPRAALGYSFGVLLRLASTLGLASVQNRHLEEAVALVREISRECTEDERQNYAREVAGGIVGHLPIIYSGSSLFEAVNVRWRTQLHENAKHPAVGNFLPELDHNEIMGYEEGPRSLLDQMTVVVLRDSGDHAQVQRRIDVTRDLVARRVAGWREVESRGKGRLARMLSTVHLGDWVSFWLAMRKEVDPSPVDTIEQLKKALG